MSCISCRKEEGRLEVGLLPIRKQGAEELSLQRDFLSAPVPDFSDPEIVFRAAVDGVDHAELLRHLAGLSELADDLAGETDLVDFAVVHALGIVRVGTVEELVRAA